MKYTTPTTGIHSQLVLALPCMMPNSVRSIRPPEKVKPTPTFRMCMSI